MFYGYFFPEVIEKRIEIPNINIKYPEVYTGNESIDNKINERLREELNQLMKDQSEVWNGEDGFVVQGGFETTFQNNLISIVLVHYSYNLKVTHSIDLQRLITFDLQTAEEVSFSHNL